MGTHRLRDTTIIGRDEVLASMPDFDLYRLRRVVELHLAQTGSDVDADDYTMQLEVEYEDVRGSRVVLEFSGVKAATLPRMMPSFYFAELEIDDLSSSQLEGVRFRAKDYGMTEFEVLCKAVTIKWRSE